jgi:glycosyltransferase involved in cell wall biosynthesis
MPNAILEAMLYGLIIVSTPVGGIPDVVTDGENGILFLLNERSASVKRLSELLHDSTRVTQVAMLNHKIACGSFVPEKVAQRLMCIIISVLAKSAMSMEKF